MKRKISWKPVWFAVCVIDIFVLLVSILFNLNLPVIPLFLLLIVAFISFLSIE